MSAFADRVREQMARNQAAAGHTGSLLVPLTDELRRAQEAADAIAWQGGDPSFYDQQAARIRERIQRGETVEVLF